MQVKDLVASKHLEDVLVRLLVGMLLHLLKRKKLRKRSPSPLHCMLMASSQSMMVRLIILTSLFMIKLSCTYY